MFKPSGGRTYSIHRYIKLSVVPGYSTDIDVIYDILYLMHTVVHTHIYIL